jgi:hypothetical protein
VGRGSLRSTKSLLSGRGFIFFGPGFGRKDQQEIPVSFEIFAGYLGKLTRYLLKEMLGIDAPQKGKGLDGVIYLDPL